SRWVLREAGGATPPAYSPTRLRCPSEAAYPQPSPPPRFCRCRRATPPSASGCSSPGAGAENCKRSSRNRCRPRLAAVGVSFQMHLFILDRAPQPFEENVVHEAAASVHRNRDAGRRELAGESRGGEGGALIAIENPRLSEPKQRLLQRRRARRSHRWCSTAATPEPPGWPSR